MTTENGLTCNFSASTTCEGERHLLQGRPRVDSKKLNQLRFLVSHQLGQLSVDYNTLGNQAWGSGYVRELANLQSRFEDWQRQLDHPDFPVRR